MQSRRRGAIALAMGLALAGALGGRGASAADGAAEVRVQLGPRPFFLVEDMADSPLKRRLQACARERESYRPTRFSIAHRGAPLQFPEHTRESYEAAARMGAGILECDVTFTKDKELVCRHSQNDLHTTTNILATPLAATCIRPFQPARFDADGRLVASATAECRTSELTLAEFRTLRGKMDGFDPRARTVAEYLGGTAPWRTDLYAGPTSGTLMSHRESIALFQRLGVDMVPELKKPSVAMPFDGFTQEAYARKLIAEYREAGVPPARVWPQSFERGDILTWLRHEPGFGRQAVYLDAAANVAALPDAATLEGWRAEGIRIVAPPLFALLAVDGEGRLRPSAYARAAKAAGLEIITWSLERSGLLAGPAKGFYYQGLESAVRREGDVMQVLDVLAAEVGVLGVFSDWPATVSFYANCTGRP